MLKGRALDHIGVACVDVEADAQWYQEALGFVVIGKFPGSSGHNVYFLKNGDTTYELFQNDHLEAACRGKVDHISFVSHDIEGDYAYCQKQGYAICTDGIEDIPHFWDKGCRYFKIKSPTGEQIELNQIL